MALNWISLLSPLCMSYLSLKTSKKFYSTLLILQPCQRLKARFWDSWKYSKLDKSYLNSSLPLLLYWQWANFFFCQRADIFFFSFEKYLWIWNRFIISLCDFTSNSWNSTSLFGIKVRPWNIDELHRTFSVYKLFHISKSTRGGLMSNTF